MLKVQVGWKQGAYTTKLTTASEVQAMAHYNGYLVHSGGKKRLVDETGRVIHREITR